MHQEVELALGQFWLKELVNRPVIQWGESTFIVSVLVLLMWIPLRETPGIGTILNVILIAMAIDVMAPFLPNPTETGPALIQTIMGIMVVGIGSGFYLTANLGPGPRDGWMTGIQQRSGWPIGRVRIGIEIVVLSLGIVSRRDLWMGDNYVCIRNRPYHSNMFRNCWEMELLNY